MTGTLSFEVDHAAGLICVTGAGMWTTEQVAAHFGRLELALKRERSRRAGAFVLVDLRRAAVQTSATSKTMHDWTSRIYRDSDHVAVVCATTLLALQIKRQAKVQDLVTFTEMSAARDWLDTRGCAGATAVARLAG